MENQTGKGEPKAILLVVRVTASSGKVKPGESDIEAARAIQNTRVFEIPKRVDSGHISAIAKSDGSFVRIESKSIFEAGESFRLVGVPNVTSSSTIDSGQLSFVEREPDARGILTLEGKGKLNWKFECVRIGEKIPVLDLHPTTSKTPASPSQPASAPTPEPRLETTKANSGLAVESLPSAEPVTPPVMVYTIPVDRIRPNPNQPRTYFRKDGLRQLANSLKENGQSEAIEVIKVQGVADIDFEIVKGERRWRAAKIAGLETLRAIVMDSTSIPDKDAQRCACFLADFNRESYCPVDAMRFLVEQQKKGRTHQQLASLCGMSVGWVIGHLILDRLDPSLLDLLDENLPKAKKLSLTIARLICYAPLNEQMGIYDAVKQEKSKRMQILVAKRLVANYLAKNRLGRKPKPADSVKKMQNSIPRILADATEVSDYPEGVFISLALFGPKEIDPLIATITTASERIGILLTRLREAKDRVARNGK